MLLAIFFACFHPERGPSVIYSYPPDFTITPRSRDDSAKADLYWGSISFYVIPLYELCNQSLSIIESGYNILGYPVSLEEEHYERNRFTFNVCFVLDEEEDSRPWEPLVRKTAEFFTALEQDDGILHGELRMNEDDTTDEIRGDSTEPSHGVAGVLQALLENINAYGETCIRLDDLHVLNLRLDRFVKRMPSSVRSWDVPLLVRPLPERSEFTWDLALDRICPYIDGINHVLKIAELADVELGVVQKAVRELVHHGRVLILDLFHFQAHYGLTTDFTYFVRDEAMLDECLGYITTDDSFIANGNNTLSPGIPSSQASMPRQTLISLYRALNPGISVHAFVLVHQKELSSIDIRRFITFGVLKGFLRRVQKFALAIDSSVAGSEKGLSGASSFLMPSNDKGPLALASRGRLSEQTQEDIDRAWRRAALSSGWETPPTEPPSVLSAVPSAAASGVSVGRKRAALTARDVAARDAEDEKLQTYLDGTHCLDQICVEMHMSEKRTVERLKSGRFGDVMFFSK